MFLPPKHQNTKYHQRKLSGRLVFVLFSAFVFLWQILVAHGQETQRNEFPPPEMISLDVYANTVIWRQPGDVLLFEDFESGSFPPEGWTVTSAGKGWKKYPPGPFLTWFVPWPGSTYAVANDDSASVQNNGSLDRLITPAIDLTSVDNCRLTFSSFFTAAYGEAASVEYRLGPTMNWIELARPAAEKDWHAFTYDLSAFSGTGGQSFFQLAFHADDRGNHASGWAIDNVELSGNFNALRPIDYLLFFDDAEIGAVMDFSCHLPFSAYGEEHRFGICARYLFGSSDTVEFDFESRYLPPPMDLSAHFLNSGLIRVEWENPYHTPLCDTLDLQFVFNCESPELQGGCESDGNFIYICYQNSGRIDKYDLAGNLAETFTIAGVPGLSDLAFDKDHGYMYGGNGGTTVYLMSFYTKTLIEEFTAPVEVRGIAYDPYNNYLIANNLSSDITVFFPEGDILFSFPVGDYGNIHGLAIDWSNSSNRLWAQSRDSTGALLVQYNFNTGQPTGLMLDVSPLAQNGGIGGGLFIAADLYGMCTTLGGILQNDVVFNYALHENLPSGWKPPGLDRFKLYKDDSLVYSWTWYYWNTSCPDLPDIHKFEIAARYNLDTFGFPGQFAESLRSEPFFLTTPDPDVLLELELEERWISETFTENKWSTEGEGWLILDNFGHPAPTAVFRSALNPDNYDGKLTSAWLNVRKKDSCDIQLVFDLRILDWAPTGEQTMALEALNSNNNTWQTVRIYRNDTVVIDFFTDTILLSQFVINDMLRFRFHLYGVESTDVSYWMMDNIRVEYTCHPPYELHSELTEDQDSILVSWQHHYSGMEQWLHYDDGAKFTETGLDSGPENWYDIAVRWDPSSLYGLDDCGITRLAFVPTMTEASYILKIWKGEDASQPVYEKIIPDYTPGDWNIIEIDPPVPVDIFSDLWIGYSCSSRGGNPFSMDKGPAVDGFGNLIRINSEWTTMLSINPEFDFNFNIQALLVKPPGHTETFQVYRKIGEGPFQHIATTDSSFIKLPLTGSMEAECFRSRIICFNRPEFILVSGFSNIDCVIPVALNEDLTYGSEIKIYPNPTAGTLIVESPEPVEQLDILDVQGHSVKTVNNRKQTFSLDLSLLDHGIYLLKIQTKNLSATRKIILFQK